MKKISRHERILRTLVILSAIVVFASAVCNGQDKGKARKYTRSGDNFSEVSAAKVARDSMKTAYTFTTKQGDVYPIYFSQKGRAYIGRVSKKTGKYYRQYLAKEIEEEIVKENL